MAIHLNAAALQHFCHHQVWIKIVSTASLTVVNVSAANSKPFQSKGNYIKKETFHSPLLVFTSTLFSTSLNALNLSTLPSDKEKFLLHEYDCRMKRHIAFQTANFEFQNAKKRSHKVNNVIYQQRKFEEAWPSKRSKAKRSIRVQEFFNEDTLNVNIKLEELDMSELLKEAKRTTMLLRYTLEEL